MIVSKEHKESLITIAKKLERKTQSFPKDEKGEPTETYLEYLSLMYEPDIAKLVIPLPVFPETMSIVRFSKLVGIDKAELMEGLESHAKRVFIIKLGRGYAQPMPLFIYDIPFILKENYDREDIIDFARLSRKFFEDGYYKTWETSRKGYPRSRVLTVSEEIEPEKEIVPIEEVYTIIDRWDDFVVIPCPCRQRMEIEGIRECKDKYPIHNCILFGPYAKAIMEMDDSVARVATKEEIKKLTKEAAEIGLVHSTDNRVDNCNILCACCECCCGLLAGLTRFDNPRAIAKANYISLINEDECSLFGTCEGRCKFNAITLEDFTIVNSEKCVGCGLCSVTCPNDAITMRRFEREQILT